MFQWLKSSCSFGVILEIIAIDVDLIEELNGDPIVAAFAEMHPILWVRLSEIARNLTGDDINNTLKLPRQR